MTWLPAIKSRILHLLQAGPCWKPVSVFEIADELHEAPFRIRAELQDLRRSRLVRRTADYQWFLTAAGERWCWADQQQEMNV